jgi:hypothetical protein
MLLAKKRRTRQHIIADLSANCFERHALLCGYSVERIMKDYGVDLAVYTYDERGEFEPGNVQVQLKATDKLNILRDGVTVAVEVERSHVEAWLDEIYPCVLVLYSAKSDEAYWINVQQYFSQPRYGAQGFSQKITVRIPMTNVLCIRAVQEMRETKNGVHLSMGKVSGWGKQLLSHS